MKIMTIKLALWLLWAGFITYILFLAPPLHLDETLSLSLSASIITVIKYS